MFCKFTLLLISIAVASAII